MFEGRIFHAVFETADDVALTWEFKECRRKSVLSASA